MPAYTILRLSDCCVIQWFNGNVNAGVSIPAAVAVAIEAKRADPSLYRVCCGDGNPRIEWMGGSARIPSFVALAIQDDVRVAAQPLPAVGSDITEGFSRYRVLAHEGGTLLSVVSIMGTKLTVDFADSGYRDQQRHGWRVVEPGKAVR